MEFTAKQEGDVLVLSLNGDLIGENSGSGILEAANEAINKGVSLCLVDIEHVKYINSSGIGVLITLLTKFRNQGGEVAIVKPSDHVKKLLIITKLTAIFKISDNQQEAMELLKS
ncbi:STAS domain-containing protein [Roseivirga misakiensis]|uniref:Anti-sigma factor antagonist n=1 Tax=Roseivirga misakiensis TaxID=1563681 RepID=A0A1E5T2S6_9BACT|nr:STAS domain-containing protein [Roseivirga misakiensis]OEK05672.1 anti-anti-sigma factor [Roseivirga misakiensis]